MKAGLREGLKGSRLERESPTGCADGAHLGFKALARPAAAAGHHSKIRRENIAQRDWFREWLDWERVGCKRGPA